MTVTNQEWYLFKNMELDDWQKEIIEDINKYILLCKGRQIGGTSTFAVKAVKWMIEKKARILVGSITEEQAKLVIVMVYELLQKDKKLIAKGKNKPTLDRIRLINGAEIRSRPVGAMGDGFRGFTADVNWFNEASKWPELAFTSIMPSLLTTGGEMWMDSTPFGKKGYFWRCFENKNKLWKIYYKNSEEVIFNRPISPGWKKEKREEMINFLADQKREMSALQYGQEYMGLFLEELNRFFEEDLINKVCTLGRKGPSGGEVYIGHDLARMGGDSFTAEVIEVKNNKYFHRDSYSEKKLLTTRNEELILQFDKTWNPVKIGIDAGAGTLGVSVLDHLRKTEIKKKLIPMNNRKIVIERKDDKEIKQRMFKEDMYDNLKSMMEHEEIWLLNDEKVKASLASVQIELVKDTHGSTVVRIFGADTHIVEGLIRAAWLAKNERNKNFWVYAI